MKKKIAAVLLMALVLCLLCAGASAYTKMRVVRSGTVYAEHSTDSERIGYVSEGDTVMVEAKGNDWARIIWGSYGSGYVKSNRLGSYKKKSSESTTTYYVNENSCRLRWDDDSSSGTICSLKKGQKLYVVSIHSGWAKVRWNGDYGYIKTKHLTRTKPGSSSSSSSSTTKKQSLEEGFKNFAAAEYHAVVTPNKASGYVNLRWGPSTSTQIEGVCYAGKILKVIAQNETWCQVQDEETGKVGYMMRRFLVEVPETLINTDEGTAAAQTASAEG